MSRAHLGLAKWGPQTLAGPQARSWLLILRNSGQSTFVPDQLTSCSTGTFLGVLCGLGRARPSLWSDRTSARDGDPSLVPWWEPGCEGGESAAGL